MENYFDFYGIPISFRPNQAEVRRIYYANSKKYHPDFFTLESEKKQAEVLELSSKNNKAFELFSNPDALMKYVLELKGVLNKEKTDALPPMFLMEMMDVNEELEMLASDFSVERYNQILSDVQHRADELYREVAPILENYNEATTSSSELEKVKNFFLKKQYLLRIKEKLSTFASR